MTSLMQSKVTVIWIFLAILTIILWFLGDGYNPDTESGARIVTVSLMAIAFFKARMVIMHFMELLEAPWGLRGIFEFWIFVVFFAVIGLYMNGGVSLA